MARFRRRGNEKSIEQLLRANRPEPRDEFAASILRQVTHASASAASRRTRSARRLGVALALTVVALGLAAVLGGISAATAGLGGIAHVATKAVTPSHAQPTTLNATSSKTNGNDDAAGDQDSDNHQYKVGVCHWADHKYVLIFVSPQGAANHLKNHPDKLPVNGRC